MIIGCIILDPWSLDGVKFTMVALLGILINFLYKKKLINT